MRLDDISEGLSRRWQQWIAVPETHEDTARQGRLFNTLMFISMGMLVTMGTGFLMMGPLRLLPFPQNWIRAALPFLLLPLNGYCLWQSRRGHTQAMIRLYVGLNLVATIGVILLVEGSRSSAWLLFIWSATVAGTLLTPVYSLYIALGAVAAYPIVFLLERIGYHPPINTAVEAQAYVLIFMGLLLLVFTAGLLTFINMHSLRETMEHLRFTANALNERALAEQEQSRRLQQTVQRYVEAMSTIRQGHLSVRVSLDEKAAADDPLHLLGQNLNEMVSSLQEMIDETRSATNLLTQAVGQILVDSGQQVAGANEQSAAITQATATIDEVRAIAEQTALRSRGVADLSQRTADVARAGQQAVGDTVGGISQVKNRVEAIAHDILALSEQAQQIGTIVASVNEIASESQMLALNAAVEAARAGEAGKGFAVVAAEVRTLAEQSRAATVQVREILSEIQGGINRAVMVTEEGMKKADAGVRLAGQAGDAISQLKDSIAASSEAALQTAAAAGQQLAGMEQIVQVMHNIQEATGQAAASAQHTQKAVANLRDLAGRLRAVIERYGG